MSEPLRLEQHIVKQAIDWTLRLQNNTGNRGLLQQCEHWRAAHGDHELAWQRVQTLNAELSANLGAQPGTRYTLETSAQRLGRRKALKLLSGMLVLGSATWLGSEANPLLEWTSDYATAVGEHKRWTLADGSRLDLNTHSAVDLAVGPQVRHLHLKRGELMLHCANADIPWQVRSLDTVLQANDAQLTVRRDDHCTRLGVITGRVAIHVPGRTVRWAEPGQHYRVDRSGAVLAQPPDMDMQAWAEGLIVTRGMRLDAFLGEVSRYRPGHLGYDADVADMRLSGVFRLADTDALLQVLTQTLPLTVRYRTRWWASVQRRV